MLHVKWCSWCNAASGLPGVLVMCLHLCLQSKLLAAPVACPLSGSCDTVLSSGYAELFGVPLSAFGASWHGYPECCTSCCRPMHTAFASACSGTVICILQMLNPAGHPVHHWVWQASRPTVQRRSRLSWACGRRCPAPRRASPCWPPAPCSPAAARTCCEPLDGV
jgi:hypothetical protein